MQWRFNCCPSVNFVDNKFIRSGAIAMTGMKIVGPRRDPGRARSKVIKDLIMGSNFYNPEIRTKVDELLRLEDCIAGGIHGWAHSILYNYLKSKYPQEWAEIYEELKPEPFSKVRAEQEQWEAERRLREEAERAKEFERERRAREQWLKLGGRG